MKRLEPTADVYQQYLEAVSENVELRQYIFSLKQQVDIATRALVQISDGVMTKEAAIALKALERIHH